MTRIFSNIAQLITIWWVFTRCDALFFLRHQGALSLLAWPSNVLASSKQRKKRKGVRLADALEQLGPAFIKFGQSLSTRTDILGAEVTKDLSRLRDQLPPFSYKDAKRIIETSLNAPLDNLFDDFSQQPVAAASIAQVHRARTKDGRDVAVKVLRPNVERRFQRFTGLIQSLARTVESIAPSLRRLRPVDVAERFSRDVRMEMDLRLEAAAANHIRDIMKDEPDYRIPLIDWERTSQRVLTLQWVDGTPISDLKTIDSYGLDRTKLAETIIRTFLIQALLEGFFHADPHPGNILVDKSGAIHALDFGIVGRLDKESRFYWAEIIRGFMERDYKHVARVHFAAGYVPNHQDEAAFAQALRSVAEPILGKPLKEISVAQLLAQLFSLTETFEMRTQPQLLMMQKSLMLIEGIARQLDPNINMWHISEPLVRKWIEHNLHASTQIKEEFSRITQSLRRLPDLAKKTEFLLDRMESHHRQRHQRIMRYWYLLGGLALGWLLFH